MDETAIKNAIAGAKLAIDIVPDTCVITRVRDHMKPADWEIIAEATAREAGNKCRACGKQAGEKPLECSEVWNFDDEQLYLRLVGTAAFCRQCFRAKNITRNSNAAEVQIAVYQLGSVNAWTEDMARFYIGVCFRVWDKRSEYDWTLDLSYIRKKFRLTITPKKQRG